MKMTVYVNDFIDAFKKLRPDNFSHEGLVLLFDYLESLDEEMELDVIAICCEWSQLTFDEFLQEYELEEGEDEDEELKERIENCLRENTSIAGFTHDSVVFAQY